MSEHNSPTYQGGEQNNTSNVEQNSGFDHFQQENHTSQPGSAKLQANDDFGHFNAPQQNDDGDQFEQFGSAQPQDNVDHFGDQNQSSTQHQDGGDVYDDYFGGNNQQANTSQQGGFGGSNTSGYQGDNRGFGGESVDPEEEERLQRLRAIEDERSRKLQEKIQQERQEKEERQSKASQELNRWASDVKSTNKKRGELNLQTQEEAQKSKKENQQFKNPWEKVVANITIKDGDYPGKKDVRRMREAIINKRADLQ